MTEENGKTAIYGLWGNKIFEVIWPEARELPIEESPKIKSRVDIWGQVDHENICVYRLSPRDGEPQFKINTSSWRENPRFPEFYERLAREVEIKTGRENLTILFY